MKSYDHADKAGNVGDVWKHVALLVLLGECASSFTGDVFYYFETHAGRMKYKLSQEGEWKNGIGKLRNITLHSSDLHWFIYSKMNVVRGEYHSSWSLATELLKTKGISFKVTLCDTAPDVVQSILEDTINQNAQVRIHQTNGFEQVSRLATLPSSVLIDPPYVDENDWSEVARLIGYFQEHACPFMVWYPVKHEGLHIDCVHKQNVSCFQLITGEQKGVGVAVGNMDDTILYKLNTVLKTLAPVLDGEYKHR